MTSFPVKNVPASTGLGHFSKVDTLGTLPAHFQPLLKKNRKPYDFVVRTPTITSVWRHGTATILPKEREIDLVAPRDGFCLGAWEYKLPKNVDKLLLWTYVLTMDGLYFHAVGWSRQWSGDWTDCQQRMLFVIYPFFLHLLRTASRKYTSALGARYYRQRCTC